VICKFICKLKISVNYQKLVKLLHAAQFLLRLTTSLWLSVLWYYLW